MSSINSDNTGGIGSVISNNNMDTSMLDLSTLPDIHGVTATINPNNTRQNFNEASESFDKYFFGEQTKQFITIESSDDHVNSMKSNKTESVDNYSSSSWEPSDSQTNETKPRGRPKGSGKSKKPKKAVDQTKSQIPKKAVDQLEDSSTDYLRDR